MSVDQDAVIAKAALLPKVFLARLHVRYEKMNETLALCRANPEDDANWVELQRLLHSLAAAAALFGCDDLGEMASLVELRVKDVAQSEQKARSGALEEVAHALKTLQELA